MTLAICSHKNSLSLSIQVWSSSYSSPSENSFGGSSGMSFASGSVEQIKSKTSTSIIILNFCTHFIILYTIRFLLKVSEILITKFSRAHVLKRCHFTIKIN
ncbi:hypothetical protein BpHYR1_000638 [Brachionus plicatilis]|uniref:Uncharacterized protein n=1 Tax=Brachionus plicatilis TaxID=10195 RepID=A0A3M7RA75_BRAPC|nr:hypothetical protein BpHYR1_000638 [Brachionus plicatilis]